MIQLLGRATSGNVQKVLFLLEELGLPYERKDYGRQWENTTTPEYVAMNPIKKVPTLIDGSTVVWQSNTVLRYLASKANSALYPSDAAQRAAIESWMDWTPPIWPDSGMPRRPRPSVPPTPPAIWRPN